MAKSIVHSSTASADVSGPRDQLAPAYTPGPWYYGVAYEPEKGEKPHSYRGPGYYENSGILSANGETICGCGEYDIFGPMLNNKEREANTRLIALAPELVEALRGVLTAIALHDVMDGPISAKHQAFEIARAALAKVQQS